MIKNLELVIKDKVTGEVVYSGDIHSMNQSRDLFECYNRGDFEVKKLVAAPETHTSIVVFDKDAEKQYHTALETYDVVTRRG